MFKFNKNSELKNLIEITKKKEKVKKEIIDWSWIAKILFISFIISFFMSFISEITIPNLSLVFGILVTLLFIFVGILFDLVGVAVTSADEAVFHSMNSRKVKGAKMAVKFKKNADKVSSFCCDVIGDINSRRGMIQGQEVRTGATQIDAFIPLSNMFGYATSLRSRTQGRGQYVMEPSHYSEVPKNIAEKLISEK